MKHTKVLFIFLSFALTYLSAQKNIISGEIEYEQIRVTSNGEKVYHYNLHFNGEESYYEENIFDKFEKKSTKKSDGTTVLQPRDDNSPQFYYLNADKELYFDQFHVSQHLFVKENDNYGVKWKITDEKKEIGDFQCQKAIGEFRGRTYHAWFTPDIPLSYGPWKLNGLPGLILQAYDDSEYIYFSAKKVFVLSNNRDSSDYIAMRTSKMDFKNAMSIDSFNVKKEELLQAYFEKLSARLPKGIGPLTIDKDCKDCGEVWEVFD